MKRIALMLRRLKKASEMEERKTQELDPASPRL